MAGDPTFKRGFEFPRRPAQPPGRDGISPSSRRGSGPQATAIIAAPMKALTLVIAPVALLAACRSEPTYLPNGDLAPATAKDYEKGGIYDVSFEAIKNNPTPELAGMNERDLDMQRNLAVNANQTTRMFWSDLGRMWFADEPSPLSPYPVINTSGNP